MEMTFDFGRSTEAPMTLAEAEAAIAAGRKISEGPALMGHVHLLGPAGAASLYDDLEMLVLNLCVHVPKALTAGGRAELRMVSRNQQYRLVEQGEEIVLAEQDEELGAIEVGRFPAAGLRAALRAGGLRFADFLDRLDAVDPQWAATSSMLRRELG